MTAALVTRRTGDDGRKKMISLLLGNFFLMFQAVLRQHLIFPTFLPCKYHLRTAATDPYLVLPGEADRPAVEAVGELLADDVPVEVPGNGLGDHEVEHLRPVRVLQLEVARQQRHGVRDEHRVDRRCKRKNAVHGIIVKKKTKQKKKILERPSSVSVWSITPA